MRSMISRGCATGRRKTRDRFPADLSATRSGHKGRGQISPVPQVPVHVPERVGWRTDLSPLQKHGGVAGGYAPAGASRQAPPIAARRAAAIRAGR